MKILVTGAAGFSGSHLVEDILQNTKHTVVALDSLTYAGRLDRLAHLDWSRIQYIHWDLRHPFSDAMVEALVSVSYIIHAAAESHVMRSFADPKIFVESNVIGTLNILEVARKIGVGKFIYVSTDEVMGEAQSVSFVESDCLNPTNPYAATKAAGELLAYSYFRSFHLPVVITRTMNLFGERQNVEKFVPMTISKLIRGEKVSVHGTCHNRVWTSGSRRWLHARTQAETLLFLLEHGVPGEKYNIAGSKHTNLEMVKSIAKYLGVYADWEWTAPLGPVHDMAYDLDDSKLRKLRGESSVNFEEYLKQTVLFSKANTKWLEE